MGDGLRGSFAVLSYLVFGGSMVTHRIERITCSRKGFVHQANPVPQCQSMEDKLQEHTRDRSSLVT